MTVAQILAVGLTHLCTPGPQTGWPYHVQQELDAHDEAMEALGAADSRQAWWDANDRRVGAEARLARLLEVVAPPLPVLDYDDGIDWLALFTTAPAV
jgi:hypothetical protein